MSKIEWTRIKNDVNGNPRYVCHFLNLNTPAELDASGKDWISVSDKYNLALQRSHKIGGRKYHTKAYGGGIVFQSYSIEETEAAIERVLSSEAKPKS